MSIPIIAIVGRPNIGKSTLFNRVIGYSKAIVSDIAGTTRDRVYEYVTWRDKTFLLIDTAGIEKANIEDEIELNMQEQVDIAMSESDIILFGLDGKTSFFDEDRNILKKLYKSGKPFFIFVNKVDNDSVELKAEDEFKKVGQKAFLISAIQGNGISDLLDEATDKIIPSENFTHNKPEIKVSIIGKPNVGKSSLLNVFVGEKRSIVSDEEGTTRDSVDVDITFHRKKIRIVDTAGLRKKSKVKAGIERYSVLRATKNILRSDIVFLVIDATLGPTKQDMTLSQLVLSSYKSIVLVVNKWDLIDKEEVRLEEYEEYLRKIFGYMKWVPIIFTSATEKIRTFKLLELIIDIKKSQKKEITTSSLNTTLQTLMLRKPPQARNNKTKHPKIYYSTQTGDSPPEFTFFVNDRTNFHSSYKRYLENNLREVYEFIATPLKLIFKNRRD